jgi:cysteine-rich repeat protein
MRVRLVYLGLVMLAFLSTFSGAQFIFAQTFTATTTVRLSICGDSIVDPGEDCDARGEVGNYSTTIAGRECNTQCRFGPYCGDGILQTQFSEECDDGNNDSRDFCSATCRIEPAGSGGGGSSGGGGGGGASSPQGDTLINVRGLSYPGQTVNFLLDTRNIGSIRAGSDGRFEFTAPASPVTATLGIWATDTNNTRSVTLNNTFDVTQGVVTNVSGLIMPPTIRVNNQNIIPGTPLVISGQTIPNATVEFHFNSSEIVVETQAAPNGQYTFNFVTNQLRTGEYTLRVRSVTGRAPLFTQSSFSSSLQIFNGVDGRPTGPSDLNRDSRVNLTDFSILIFWWNTNGGNSNPPADINQNGRVSLEDFSILLFNWTG